ncbi:MAG: hypothetical protein AAFY17_07375 [Cyanobacteria bacterium J06642_11]
MDQWTRNERISIGVTLGLTILSGFLAITPTTIYLQSLAAGALGGLAHEIAQSGGKIFFIQKRQDGLYLGALTGMVLGCVAGLLVLQGFLPTAQVCPAKTVPDNLVKGCEEFVQSEPIAANTSLVLEMFLAGLSLKGISEAATGNEVS